MTKIESNINHASNQLYYCKVFINDIEIVPQNILTLYIREWTTGILPRLELNLNDDGMLSEVFTLDDLSNISVQIGKNAEDDPIELDFMLQDHKLGILGENQSSVIEITGLLNVPVFYF